MRIKIKITHTEPSIAVLSNMVATSHMWLLKLKFMLIKIKWDKKLGFSLMITRFKCSVVICGCLTGQCRWGTFITAESCIGWHHSVQIFSISGPGRINHPNTGLHWTLDNSVIYWTYLLTCLSSPLDSKLPECNLLFWTIVWFICFVIMNHRNYFLKDI